MPYVFRQSDLPKLDIQVDRGADFEAWKAQWTSYWTLSGLAGEDAATKVQVLTLCLSRETIAIVNNLGLSEEQRNNVDTVIQAIKRHIDGQINESVERRNLVSRSQTAYFYRAFIACSISARKNRVWAKSQHLLVLTAYKCVDWCT